MGKNDGAASLVRSDALLDALVGDMRVCVGTRWKCDNGHEWVSAHGDKTWFQMPTTCRECGQQAMAHRGEWKTFRECTSNKKDERRA